MHELTVIDVTDDGTCLILADDQGQPFAQVRLCDEVRGLINLTSAPPAPAPAPAVRRLSAKEVQALIRAGATVQEAAEQAGWSTDKVEKFATPILAERAHVAELAGKSPVRTRGTNGATPVLLQERVQERLRERGVDLKETEWDARRSDTGVWMVSLSFQAGGAPRCAEWSFSKSSQVLDPVNDEARWLSEDEKSYARRSGAHITAAHAHQGPPSQEPPHDGFPDADVDEWSMIHHDEDYPEDDDSSGHEPRPPIAPVVRLSEATPIPYTASDQRRSALRQRATKTRSEEQEHPGYVTAMNAEVEADASMEHPPEMLPLEGLPDVPAQDHVMMGGHRRGSRRSVPAFTVAFPPRRAE